MTVEPGSFRDRQARVFLHEGRVLRALSAAALSDWKALAASSLFRDGVAAGRIVATREIDAAAEQLTLPPGPWVAAVEHEAIPFISYPYEWTFNMLRDAALLHLDLLLAALDEKLVLKDSSAFNIQWRGSRPVHIDTPSFQRLSPGEPWVGHLQFCQLFLYPLMLTAYRGLPFQPWLRGAVDGITPADCARLMSLRDMLRPGALSHVWLQAKLQARTGAAKTSVKQELRDSGFSSAIIASNARSLRRVVAGLRWKLSSSEWSAYATTHSYSDEDEQVKRRFVAQAAASRRWRLAWDLGCNTGDYSRIVAEHADTVVAMDGDHLAVDRLYRALRDQGNTTILPLVVNLADPSPGLGWRGRERRPLDQRGEVDLVLCLALIHHLVITANVPLDEVVDWLASLGSPLVIELVTKDDPMVQQLLLNKEDIYHDYDRANFERLLAAHYETVSRQDLHQGTRTLYFLRPRGR